LWSEVGDFFGSLASHMGATDDAFAGSGRARAHAPSLLDALRRRALIIVLTTLLVGGAAAAFAYLGPKTYQSTAELLFSQTIGDELNALGLIPPTPNADKLAGDDQAIVASRRVAVLAAQHLADHPSVRSVRDDISVPLPKTSDVVPVTATASSPARAAQLANAYANAAIQIAAADQAQRTQSLVANLQNQLQRLGPKDPAAVGVRARLVQVAALGNSSSAVPQLIQPGYVPDRRSGNPLSTVLLGVLFGLILGVALALVREQSDRRLRHPNDVSQALQAPVLATIPRDNDLLRRLPAADLHPRLAEPFQMLHANLRYGHRDPVRSVVITSSRAKQGKTTVAWNLAMAAASAGQSVILLDADLRCSLLAQRYGLLPFPGLGEVVRGAASLSSAVQTVPVLTRGEEDDGDGARLNVLVAGASPPDPSAVLQSDAMAELLATARREYDLVIVDTPPIAQVADAIALLRHVDGVVVVASINSTEGSEAERLRAQLQALDARVLGAVANGGSRASGYVHVSGQRVSVG
jgi:succinoglycan biosynthesis transport protein ExoP